MRKLALIALVLLQWSSMVSAQNIGINEDGTTPDASAILDIKADDKGILVPRLSSSQMNDVASPANGLLIFNTTTGSFWFYEGGSWGELNADSDSDPTNEIQTISKVGNNITLSDGGGSVFDGDPYSTNELQTLSKSGNYISLSNGGGTVYDGDPYPTNEIQTISRSGNYIYLSGGGGSILDDDQDDDWSMTGSYIYRYNNVSIGTGPTSAYRLLVSGNSFFSGQVDCNYYLSASIFRDFQNNSYYLDPANAGISAYMAGTVYADEFVDVSGSDYYLDPSSSSVSLRTVGDHIGQRFVDINSTSFYLDPSNPTTSMNVAGNLFANGLNANWLESQTLRLTSGATDGFILRSDGAGNGSWVDPNSVISFPTSNEVIHNQSVSGTFWTHGTVNVTVAYDPTTRTISVTNNSGQGYWDVSIFANSGAGDSRTCSDLNTVGFINNGATISHSVSTCTASNQGFSIMAADETGTTTGFKMDVVIYQAVVNALVTQW